MQILVPLHYENLNSCFDKTNVYKLSTSDVKNYYDTTFYAEIAKFLYAADNHLLNDNIVGFMQNRRLLKDFNLYEAELIANNNKILVAKEETWGLSIYSQFNSCHREAIDIFKKILTKDEIDIINTNTKGFYHNIFVSSNNFFYSYADYLKNKLENAYNIYKNTKNISAKKFGAWMAERLLIIYIKLNNFETINLQLITFEKKK